jgi:hypothetical protein
MHAWDEPVETLLANADPNVSHLLLPQLGQPLEPGERRPVTPCWRSVASGEPVPQEEISAQEQALAEKLPWPLD